MYLAWVMNTSAWKILKKFVNEGKMLRTLSIVKAGKLDLAKQLIAKGHNPMVKDRDNDTALHCAAQYGKLVLN